MRIGIAEYVIPIFQRKLSLNRAAFLMSDITKTSELFEHATAGRGEKREIVQK